MNINTVVPDNFKQRKHDLGLQIAGREPTWEYLIELGLQKAEEIKGSEHDYY